MVGFGSLWLPIIVSAVVVFVVSALIRMVTPWHSKDYRKLEKEDEALQAFRTLGIPPGDYMGPQPANMQEYRTAAFMDKMKKGPIFVLTLAAGRAPGMAKALVQTFILYLVISILVACVVGYALPAGSALRSVCRIVAPTAFLAHAAADWPYSIWYARSWKTTVKDTIDAIVFAVVTALVFGWLWPR